MLNNGFDRIIKARPGYFICDVCNGTGEVEEYLKVMSFIKTTECPKCKGEGEVDWIKNVMHPKTLTYKRVK